MVLISLFYSGFNLSLEAAHQKHIKDYTYNYAYYLKAIYTNSLWMEEITNKAQKNNVSVVEMLKEDAKYMANKK